MSLAFTTPVAPSGATRFVVLAVHVLGLLGAVLCAAALNARLGVVWVLVMALPVLGGLLWSLLRGLRPGVCGWLRVTADGEARWHALRCAAEVESHFSPTRWFVIGPLVWIEGHAANDRLSLLWSTARAATGERDRLLAWLRWLERGGSRTHTPGTPSRTPPVEAPKVVPK